MENPLVGVIMGSRSDWETMKHAVDTLETLGIGAEVRALSAHRTPGRAHSFAAGAEAQGVKIIIAAAGKAAHLAGVLASLTTLPVLGAPITNYDLGRLDSLLSVVQVPAGIPVATTAIGKTGTNNAAWPERRQSSERL